MDYENPISHSVKFYEIDGSFGASKAEEESIFMRLFPHFVTGKTKDRHLVVYLKVYLKPYLRPEKDTIVC